MIQSGGFGHRNIISFVFSMLIILFCLAHCFMWSNFSRRHTSVFSGTMRLVSAFLNKRFMIKIGCKSTSIIEYSNGHPYPTGVTVVFPYHTGAAVVLHYPTGVVVLYPYPTGVVVVYPYPSGVVAVYPYPAGLVVVYPYPSGLIVVYPHPTEVVVVYPYPTGVVVF